MRNKFFSTTAKFIKRPVGMVAAAAVLGLLLGGYFYFKGSKPAAVLTVLAEKRDVVQEVSVTGRVKPAQSIELAFEKTGKIASINVDVGDRVKVGQILMAEESGELRAGLIQAEANLESEKAKLSELERGTRPEEIQVQKTKVANAKVALEDAKRNLVDKLGDAYTKSDDAVRNKADQAFANPQTSNAQLNISSPNAQLENEVESARLSLGGVLSSWAVSLSGLGLSSDFAPHLQTARANLDNVRLFLDKLSLIVNNPGSSKAVSGTSEAIPDAWKSDLSTARANVNTAISNLSAADEKFRTAESSLALVEEELALKEAGTAPEQIAAQKAKVKSAEANVLNAQVQISKTIVRSPIEGVVTKKEVKVGEIVSANVVVAAVISTAKFEMETNVPEADIAKIKVGDSASVTLDAYGNDAVFDSRVVKIDPAETIIEGVPTYKTTLQFVKEDGRIRSGMTANIDILTAKKEGVIVLPQRAVVVRNGDKIVKILKGESVHETKVEVGLKGSDGNVEIVRGVTEGDAVVIGGQ